MKTKLKLIAIELRNKGDSITKIATKLKVSKSSVFLWVKNVKLTKEQMIKLRKHSERSACKLCGKSCDRKVNKFCSTACYKQYRNSKKISKFCLLCSSKLDNNQSKFCSTKCVFKQKWDYNINEAIKTGYTPAHQATAKRLILKLKGHKCEVCSGIEWLKEPIHLVLDHINGKSNDWRIENLAYNLWEKDGKPEGKDKYYWFLAEEEMKKPIKLKPTKLLKNDIGYFYCPHVPITK